jgi:uncharacterized protein
VGTVAGLYRYPVKSMLGEAVERSHLGPAGLLGDRAYAVVDASDGVVASAKVPKKWAGLLGFRATYTTEPEPDAPLPPVDVLFPDGSTLNSDDERIHTALSSMLDREVRLSAEPRPGDEFEEVWPEIEGIAPQQFIDSTTVGHEVDGEARSRMDLGMLVGAASFFDLATLHLLTTATLARLGELAPDGTFDVRRYRPNVLVDGAGDGFAEDDWVGRTLGLGDQGAAADVAMLCMRCVMTTLPQEELPEDRGTLRAIAQHHRRDIPGLGTWACAGVYAGVSGVGPIGLGDTVTVR